MVSGGLGLKVFDSLKTTKSITAVLTDRYSEAIRIRAKESGIPCFVGNPRKGNVKSFIHGKEVDLILSINYLFLIESDLINWPRLGGVNFHGSLLPKYRGRTPHVWAIINNEVETGITAHFISEGCDEGDIILQEIVSIDPEDTGATVLEKFNTRYPHLVFKIVEMFKKGEVRGVKQDEHLASYFGKRTPDDGAIDWNWQKERIGNWVRAQAHPYPGAFTYAVSEKIIIDKIEFDNCGFRQEQPNGLVVGLDPVRVKTPNGVVRLTKIRNESAQLKTEIILS